MAWTIVRLERVGDAGVVAQYAKRSKLGDPRWDFVSELLAKEGYELGPIVGMVTRPKTEWPFTAYIYTSLAKDGQGRSGSQLHRWPVRLASKEKDIGFLDQKRHVATQEDCKLPWSGRRGGERFRCYLCGHRFKAGDGYRWVLGTKSGVLNFMVCDDCDGPDVMERWKTQVIEAGERFWWYGAT
ncbi:hypothetical protein LCGC14_0334880 [marine sediment metagenome]|uniref:Uncharacterized protein n=1 Tax=marine sediment metagenome TaxID=412755 RepID=A0A0F9TFH7_9ZZZZ